MSRSEGFAPIPTWMIRDAEVSIYALTVYAALSSRSGLREIIPGRDTLAKEARCSVRQVARALTELEELGVVRRVRRKNVTGRASNGYTLHPNGHVAVEDSQSSTSEVEDSSDVGMGLGEQGYGPGSAMRSFYRGRDSEAEIEEAESVPSFAEFWSVWPKKNSKKDAERAWSKAIKKTDAAAIVNAARAYAESPNRPEAQFVPYGATWLNGERWNDPLPAPRAGGPVSANDRVRAALDAGARVQAAMESGELIA